MWASNLLICLFCYNPAISVPRISELVIRCIAALTLLKLQESYKTLNLSSALQITFNFMKNKQPSLTLINQASLTEKKIFSKCGLEIY